MRAHARLAVAVAVVFGLAAGLPASGPVAQQPPPPAASAVERSQPPAQPPPGQPPPGQRPPVIRSGINFVSVDVIVSDKKTGQVVLDLKQGDFEVREDRKPQSVETFAVVKIDPLAAPAIAPKEIRSAYDEETEARQPNVRLFVLLLDDYHVRRGNDMAVRKPLIDFVTNQLAPQDMVAIMYPLTPVSALTFTRNRASMIAAINQFEGRKGIYEPRNEFEHRYAYYPATTVERIRNDVTMGALSGASVKLGGMRDGRKSIIFVSEGFTSTLPPQLADPVAAIPRIGNRTPPGADINDPRMESQKFFDSVDLQSRMREVYDTVNRNNTSIYAVDPRGLAVFEYDINQGVSTTTDRSNLNSSIDTLHVLANNTDGRAIVNRNDLAEGMKQIIRDASGYYLLGYTSASAPTDGKFHTIDVRVKRSGVEVRARKGYWAYTAEDAARAAAPAKAGPPPEIASALNAIVEPARSGRVARFWMGTGRGAEGKSRVTFAWEPITAAAGAGRSGDRPARVMLTATAQDGRPLFRGPIPLAADAGDPASASSAASAGASVSFVAEPGPIDLRIVVENAGGQVVDSTVETLTVPDYAGPSLSFGTPRVYRARTARELLLLRKDPDATPSAMRDFSRAERLFIRVEVYGGDGVKPEVTAKLLNRAGDAMADVPVQMPDATTVQIDFPLASLGAGEYLIQIDAKGGGASAQQLVGFKVGS
jgi:VWFA-related protein